MATRGGNLLCPSKLLLNLVQSQPRLLWIYEPFKEEYPAPYTTLTQAFLAEEADGLFLHLI
jgi:hypothetical protein